jgi:hypothetical protein
MIILTQLPGGRLANLSSRAAFSCVIPVEKTFAAMKVPFTYQPTERPISLLSPVAAHVGDRDNQEKRNEFAKRAN